MQSVILIIGLALALTSCGRFSSVSNGLETIADLQKRAADDARSDQSFHIKGVVTFGDTLADFFVIQDGSGGLRVSLPRGKVVSKSGQLAEVTGLFSKQGSTRSFVASNVSVLGPATLPPAVPLQTAADFEKHVLRRVSIEGVLKSLSLVRPELDELVLNFNGQLISVKAVLNSANAVDSWIGDKVRVTGVLIERTRGSEKILEIWTPDVHQVSVVQVLKPADPGAPSRTLPAISTAFAVHKLSEEEASLDRPVELMAVVTYSDPLANRFFVQDATDGIYIQVLPEWSRSFHAGDLVRIKGVTHPGEFAPTVARAEVTLVGVAPLPVPEPDVEATFLGQRDSRWAQLRGVVQDVQQTETDIMMSLVWGTHKFRAHVLAPMEKVRPLIDREVIVTGACGSLFNNRRQVLGIQLFVPELRFVQAVGQPIDNPFSLPIQPSDALLQFTNSSAFVHRIHVRGIVTLPSSTGPTWIRDKSQGLMIASHPPADIQNGDLVEVVGFPSAGNYGPVLSFAEIRKLSAGLPAAPLFTTADDASRGVDESQLIQLDGTLVESYVHDGVRTLRLEADGIFFSANISEFLAFPPLSAGSRLRITGICSVRTDDSKGTLLARGFMVNLRSAQDVKILKMGPWLTSGRLLAILTGTLAFAIAALFWVALLRRNVRNQTRTLVLRGEQLESATAIAHQALERARETEALEQSRRVLLELVANDEPLDRIMMETARAAEKHSHGCLCTVSVSLADGSQITASGTSTENITIDFDREPASDFLRVPIVVGNYLAGAMMLETSDGSPLSDADRSLFSSWAQFASLAVERRGLYESLSFRARYDALTGLHNRPSLYEKLGHELASARKNQTKVAVLYIDLNEFKAVNDSYGHDAGDTVLREVSERISKRVRRVDLVARLGGDEFVVVLTDLHEASAGDSIARALRSTLAVPIQIRGTKVECGASIGVAVYPDHGDQPDSLIKHADQEMYSEKSRRRKSLEDQRNSIYA